MTLLMGAPVFRRLVRTRNTLPFCSSSSLDKQTASTIDRPDHRCNCIHAFTRSWLRGWRPLFGMAARTALYSFGSKGRTLLASSTLTWMLESWETGLAGMMPASEQNLKNDLTRSWLLRLASGDSKGHAARHDVRCERVMSFTKKTPSVSQKVCSRLSVSVCL